MRTFILSIAVLLPGAPVAADAQKVFSGPQVGEKLVGFKVKGVYDDAAGKDFDLVSKAAGKPVMIVFVHKVTRPSVGTARLLMKYAGQRKKDLTAGLVFLSDDATETVNWMKRARRALPSAVPVGIAADGGDGPGAYGLNRKVTLTILIGKENKVTANFALVQPSVQADAPKVLKELVKVIGGKAPTLAQLGVRQYRGRDQQDPNLRPLLAPVIQKTATKEEVDAAAKKVEEYAAKHPVARRQIGDIARRIIAADRLTSYGTARAQHYLQKWAKEFKAQKPKR